MPRGLLNIQRLQLKAAPSILACPSLAVDVGDGDAVATAVIVSIPVVVVSPAVPIVTAPAPPVAAPAPTPAARGAWHHSVPFLQGSHPAPPRNYLHKSQGGGDRARGG